MNRIELEHATVMFARMGQEVGIQVAQRAREHDVVSKL